MSENEVSPTLLESGASIALDCVPIIGTGKSVAELYTGKDAITGEEINRWISAGGLVLSLIPFGKAAVKSARLAWKARGASKLAYRTAYGAATKKEALARLDRVFKALPEVASKSPKSRYQYELLRKQLRMQEGAITKAEKEIIGNIGGHSFPKHSLRTDAILHKTGEFRTQLGHDFGRFGKTTTKAGAKQETLLIKEGEDIFGANIFTKDLGIKAGGEATQFGIGTREGFYKYIKEFLLDKDTVVVPLKRGRVAYVNQRTKVILYEPLNHAYEPTILKYKKSFPSEVTEAMFEGLKK